MKAILLGPGGQLGTDIRRANETLDTPIDLHSIDRSVVDLSDFEKVKSILSDVDFDVLINCSSYHKTDEVEKNAQTGFLINAHLVKLLGEISQAKKARFVHVSTDYVFGGQAKRTPLDEQDGKAPVNVYGASKAMGEDLALMACEDTTILRVASLFGVAGASGKGGNFVETMIKFGREKGALKVVADQRMSPTSTKDIASSLFALLKAGAPAGVWNVVNSGDATWFEFAEAIILEAKINAEVSPIQSIEYPTPAVRPPYSVLSNSKLASAIGAAPRHWRDALGDYLKDKGHI